MKIVDYNTFINLPKGVLYSYYTPVYTNGLMIKDESLMFENGGSDWYYYDLLDNPSQDSSGQWLQYVDVMMKMDEGGESIPAEFNCLERDGLYDYDRKFLIYEQDDIKNLISKLNSLLK